MLIWNWKILWVSHIYQFIILRSLSMKDHIILWLNVCLIWLSVVRIDNGCNSFFYYCLVGKVFTEKWFVYLLTHLLLSLVCYNNRHFYEEILMEIKAFSKEHWCHVNTSILSWNWFWWFLFAMLITVISHLYLFNIFMK